MVIIQQLETLFNNCLHTTTYNEKTALVKKMIQTFGINAMDLYGDTMLTHAILMNNTEIAAILIELGVYVNKADIHGKTPLQLAAERNNTQLVNILIFSGAEYTIPQFSGFPSNIQSAIIDMLSAEDNMGELN